MSRIRKFSIPLLGLIYMRNIAPHVSAWNINVNCVTTLFLSFKSFLSIYLVILGQWQWNVEIVLGDIVSGVYWKAILIKINK